MGSETLAIEQDRAGCVVEMAKMMVGNIKDIADENQRLRARIAELERQWPEKTVHFVPTGEVRAPKKGEVACDGDDFLVAVSDWGICRPIYRRVDSPPAGDHIADTGKMVEAPQPEQPSDDGQFKAVIRQSTPKFSIEELRNSEWTPMASCILKSDAERLVSFANGSSTVHRELEEAKREIERLKKHGEDLQLLLDDSNDVIKRQADCDADLRKDREAWEAVWKHKLCLDEFGRGNGWEPLWSANLSDESTKFHADPRDAVLELAKRLEGGK